MPDVAVIGGGIVGICSALSLVEAGADVTLIERDAPGQGTSFGNAGVISPWSIVPQSAPGIWKQIPGWLLHRDGPASVSLPYGLRLLPWLARFLRAGQPKALPRIVEAMHLLNSDCITLYRQHLSGTGQEDLIRDSNYVHAFRNANEADPDSAGYHMRRSYGARIERIDANALHVMEPALSEEFQAAIVIKDQARALNPGRIGQVLCDKFQQLGGRVKQASVTGLSRSGRWQVSTDQGDVLADQVILSAGAWSAPILAKLGVKIPLAAERGYHISCPDPGVVLNNSVMDMDRKFVASSMEAGLRAAGTAEFAPMDAPPNPHRVAAIKRGIAKMLPELNQSNASDWMGVRPSMPDSLPCIGEIPGQPGLIAAFGHSHYGLMMAPKTGRLVADIAMGTLPNVDLSALSPARF